MILDGEAVALDESGVPSFGEMQNRARSTRVEFWAFDILQLDGRSLLRAKYSDRRRVLEALAEGGGLIVPDPLPGDGPEALEYARKQRWEGVVAKKRDSTYQPGRRSSSWIKDKIWNTQEVVIGGWREGTGGRTSRHRRADARHSRKAAACTSPGGSGPGSPTRNWPSSGRPSNRWRPTNHRSTHGFPRRTRRA